MKITRYNITTEKITNPIKLACVSDLHARPEKHIINHLKHIKPDLILLAGDILEVSTDYMEKRNRNALDFLFAASNIAPCYYCFGNHEIYYSHAKFGQSKVSDPELRQSHIDLINQYGINMINDTDTAITVGNSTVLIGGLVCGRDMDPALNSPLPDLNFLSDFSQKSGFKLLLCHYPQYYPKHLKSTDIDLIFSGHAHGGQWRIFGQGVYAPHQGIFPKYTSGIHDGRLIISRGAVNNSKPIPRFFNPSEILEIQILPKK
jgi:predicted MPP superfamily phosphohydrolase